VSQERGGIFYGWYIVAVCFVVNFFVFGISVNTFTVYVTPIEESMGWTRDQVTLAMGLAPIAMALAAPFMGRFIDRFGAKVVMAAGAFVIGVSSMLLAKTESRLYFYIVYSIAGVGQAGATIIPISLVISNWFDVKRGRALGIVMTGTGLGASVMVPVTTKIVESWNWRVSYFVMGLIILLMIPLVLLFVRTRPSDMGLHPDGEEHALATPKQLIGSTIAEAVKTKTFWLIGAMMALSGFVAMGIGVNLMPYLQKESGHKGMIAAGIISIISIFTVIGKVGIGAISDRWGIRKAVLLAFTIIVIGIILMMGAKAILVAIAFAVVYGFAIGAPLLINPALTADCFGLKHFGGIFGILTMLNTVGVAMGAVLLSVLYVKSGSYMPVFLLSIVLMAVAGLAGFMTRHEVAAEEPVTQEA
jgi:MFS family permease